MQFPFSLGKINNRKFSGDPFDIICKSVLLFSYSRSLGELGCVQSFLPIYSMTAASCLTSHLTVNVRAFCELSHGTFCRTCQDR